MKNFLEFAVKKSVIVNLIMIFVIVVGLLSLQRLPREMFPDFSLERILITIVYPGASPEEIEDDQPLFASVEPRHLTAVLEGGQDAGVLDGEPRVTEELAAAPLE